MSRLIIFLFLLSCIVTKTNSQTTGKEVGKIIMQKKDNFIILRAQVENEGLLFKDELSYNFIALKKDEKGNYSNNKQEGEFSLKPNEEKELGILRVNIGEKEELRSYLFIKHKNKLVSKDSLWLVPKKNQSENEETNKEKDFFLKGIVLDEAITKIGKDFHDYFYQEYLLSGRKYPFIIKIKEKPGLARSSIIYIEAEDSKIHEFFSKPDEEYLKTNVKIVLQRASVYAKKREALRKANKI